MIKFPYLFSFQNLISAYYQCRKRKRLKSSAAEFEFYLEKKLFQFQKDLPENKVDLNFILSSINSYYAHFMHAETYKLRKHLWGKTLWNSEKLFQAGGWF